MTKQRKPVYVYTDRQMCSAAYWIGCAGSEIWSSESVYQGNIGAYIEVWDFTELLENEGIKVDIHREGKYKAMFHPLRTMTEVEVALLKAELNVCAEQFKATVQAHRPRVTRESMEGQCFDGPEALRLGLIDGVSDSLQELVEVVAAASGI